MEDEPRDYDIEYTAPETGPVRRRLPGRLNTPKII